MSLAISFRSELLKSRRCSLLYVCLIGAALMPLLSFVEFYLLDGSGNITSESLNQYFFEGTEALNLLLLPLYTILLCTLLPQIEYRNNTWKQVLASPQLKRNIFLSKFLTIQLMILLFLIAYNLMMAGSAVAANLINPDLNLFNHGLDWKKLFIVNTRSWTAILAMSAIQFWLGLRFKNFITPLAIGFCLWLAASAMVFELHLQARLFPYTYPILSVLSKHKALNPLIMWSSVTYCIVFLVFGFIDFRNRRAKG